MFRNSLSLLQKKPGIPGLEQTFILLFTATLTPDARGQEVTDYGSDGENGAPYYAIPGAPGNNGANGTDGGNSRAHAATDGASYSQAVAYGGDGGIGGYGDYSAGGKGGDGGNSGDAEAVAQHIRTTGSASAVAGAYAGSAGNGGPGAIHGMSGRHGTASARAKAATGAGPVFAHATAKGSTTVAAAEGNNTSADKVEVSATVQAVNGRSGRHINGEDQPLSTLEKAYGSSTGGGEVEVIGTVQGGEGGFGIRGGTGGDAVVSGIGGRTTGKLVLKQSATGGTGGDSVVDGPRAHGAGGHATSTLTCLDTQAADLRVTSEARGGPGGGGNGRSDSVEGEQGGSGGAAKASLNVTSRLWIDAHVTAIGGVGGLSWRHGGVPGVAEILPSTAATLEPGGVVMLTALQRAGIGDHGGDSFITDRISGAAPDGILSLTQQATGGEGGSPPTGEKGGDGGDASSSLQFTGGTENRVQSYVTAEAGMAGRAQSDSGRCGGGGQSHAAAAFRVPGDLELHSIATAGSGQTGGSAAAISNGISTGPGAVFVSASAKGGMAFPGSFETLPGNAEVSASGESAGGEVTVFATAEGGRGTTSNGRDITLENAVRGGTGGKLILQQTARAGNAEMFADAPPETVGGRGGNAASILRLPAGNSGGGPIEAAAYALGGFASGEHPGLPGDATALVEVTNNHNVHAAAHAIAGYTEISRVPAGLGKAEATAVAVSTKPGSLVSAYASGHGRSGERHTAVTKSFGPAFSGIGVSVASAMKVESSLISCGAACGFGMVLIPHGTNMGVNAMPGEFPVLAPSTRQLLQGNTCLAQIWTTGGFSTGSTRFKLDTAGLTGPVRLVLVTAQVPELPAGGEIQFSLTRNGAPALIQTFTSGTEAASYFSNRVIELGQARSLSETEFLCTISLSGGNPETTVRFSSVMVLAASQTAFGAWAHGHGVSADRNDADGDGESNLAEFAFNSSPTARTADGPGAPELLADRIRWRFNRRQAAKAGLEYTLESSTRLGTGSWQPLGAPWEATVTPLDDLMETVTCDLPRTAAALQTFLRMRITRVGSE